MEKMNRLKKLLNDYQREELKETWEDLINFIWDVPIAPMINSYDLARRIISKQYNFIWWLLDNNYIWSRAIGSVLEKISPVKVTDESVLNDELSGLERIVMYLSIAKYPMEALAELLNFDD